MLLHYLLHFSLLFEGHYLIHCLSVFLEKPLLIEMVDDEENDFEHSFPLLAQNHVPDHCEAFTVPEIQRGEESHHEFLENEADHQLLALPMDVEIRVGMLEDFLQLEEQVVDLNVELFRVEEDGDHVVREVLQNLEDVLLFLDLVDQKRANEVEAREIGEVLLVVGEVLNYEVFEFGLKVLHFEVVGSPLDVLADLLHGLTGEGANRPGPSGGDSVHELANVGHPNIFSLLRLDVLTTKYVLQEALPERPGDSFVEGKKVVNVSSVQE